MKKIIAILVSVVCLHSSNALAISAEDATNNSILDSYCAGWTNCKKDIKESIQDEIYVERMDGDQIEMQDSRLNEAKSTSEELENL